MLDVGNVARVFLQDGVSPRWAKVISGAFRCDFESLNHWLPFFVSLHDIGKLSAPFQRQSRCQTQLLIQAGFSLEPMEDLKHALVGQASLRFENLVAFPGILKNILGEMIGGHHGAFSQSDAARYAFRLLQKDEPGEWRKLRSEGIAVLQDYFQFDSSPLNPEETNVSTAVIALTGFTVLCDWIGSNSVYFNLEPNTPYETYARMSYERAWNGVKNAGFMQPFKSSHPVV
ncbi:MAG: CRISPR-associated endonuclease Cas3'', partial [Smithella sp.]|nr:CRISPR-associated endonuclease Cas3'' [Smithella sp.]